MRRKFNYTGRKKIHRSSVVITLAGKETDLPSFNVQKISLDDYNLPNHAPVYLEAYDGKSYMRFNLGIVGSIKIPDQRNLSEIQRKDAINFRLKVVDESQNDGRLLAVANNVVTRDALPEDCILPVGYDDLGRHIWQLDFSGETPILYLNNRLSDIGIHDILKNDPKFSSLVFPSVVKEILFQILVIYKITDLDGDEWHNYWLKFICEVCGAELPPEIEDNETTGEIENIDSILEWINNEALNSFYSSFDAITNYINAYSGDSE